MKQTNFLRKTATLFAVLLLAGIALFSKVSAQAIFPALLPDNIVGPPSGYPNSSTIDYSNFFVTLATQFTVMVSDGGPGGPPPMLWTNDLATPGVWFPTPIPLPPGCSPDVIVGNDLTTPGDLLIGMVATLPTCGGGNDVMLFIFRVPGPAPYGPAFPIGVFNISGTCQVTGPAHIDIIDEYSTPIGAPALPQASKFAICWKDNSPGKSIMGYYANLNAPFPGLTFTIDANPNLVSPDVAAVERLGCAGMEDWALFTYIDPSPAAAIPDKLYYREWRTAPAPALFAPMLYDNTVKYMNNLPFISNCRIDAIDDFTQNVPGGGNATFEIVTSVLMPGATDIFQYNDIDGPLPPAALSDLTLAVCPFPGTMNFVPQVTAGQGNFYTVGYYTIGVPGGPNYYVTPVDWLTTTPANMYQVNTFLWGPSPGWPFGICVSGTHNTNVCPVQQLFAGWESGGLLWEKYNASPLCVPYLFKPAHGTDPGDVNANDWQLTHNPASDHVVLNAPAGYKASDGTDYRVTDLSGKVLLQGSVTEAKQQISVMALPAGMYLLHLGSKDDNTKTIKFVKQ